MHLRVAAIGQRMPAWVNSAWQEYARRFPRSTRLDLLELPAEKRGKNADVEKLKALEGERLMASAPAAALRIALDIGGLAWSTEELADQLRGWMAGGRDVWFWIGGPDGLSPQCLAVADLRWSLGPLTLPHPLVRVLLAEQLYRAWALTQNHPYHRA
jgi:23S rRNA (pseudouridine1915-N3)-methyltransferase